MLKLLRLKDKYLDIINYKDSEIINLSLKVDFKNETMKMVKNDLDSIIYNINEFGDRKMVLEALRKLKILINNNIEKENYSDKIELVKGNFNHRLELKYKNLSENDKKLASLLRINLSSKQIAEVLNINVGSVEVKRVRLRKKMNISNKMKLSEAINSL